VAGSDQTITHWDVVNTRPLATLRGHSLEVWRLALLPDGKTLVSGSGDGEILVWDLRAGGVKDCLTLPIAPRFCWRFAPGSESIVTCDLDGDVIRWTGRDFQERQTLVRLGGGLVNVALSHDCGTVAASFTNGIIRVLDLNQGSLRHEIKTGSSSAVVWGFADGSNRLLVVDEQDKSLHEWNLGSAVAQPLEPDLADWQVHGAFPHGSRERSTGPAIKKHLDAVSEARRLPDRVSRLFVGAFSQDHQYFARTRPMGVVEVAEGESGRTLGQVRGFLQGVHSLAFSPDSRRLAIGSDDRQAVKLWDLQSFQELVTLRGQSTAYSQTRFSPDGNLLGTMNSRGVLHVWRAPSWAEIDAAEQADGPGIGLRPSGHQ
jgi:WD40 repeat protein